MLVVLAYVVGAVCAVASVVCLFGCLGVVASIFTGRY